VTPTLLQRPAHRYACLDIISAFWSSSGAALDQAHTLHETFGKASRTLWPTFMRVAGYLRSLWIVFSHLSFTHLHQEIAMQTAIKTPSITTACILTAAFFALGGAAMGGKAQAAEPAQSFATIVAYGDLNLDSEQGARMLYARLRNAAQSVCSSLEGRNLIEKRLWQACFDKAVDSAVVQVNKTSVTALHNQMVSHSIKG
jgi:UrcA family protein